jgi:hypothetical protein
MVFNPAFPQEQGANGGLLRYLDGEGGKDE